MFQKAEATLPSLPMEMLHRIFDELDGTTVFLAVRDVCQRLRAAADNYRRYALDFTALSKPDFHRLLHLIRPKCVTALSLSDADTNPGQIGLFLSLVDLHRFTRLRSLTLLKIDCRDLCSFLEHAERCSLTYLILDGPFLNSMDTHRAQKLFCSILAQASLVHLELLDSYLCGAIDQCHWLGQYQMRYLRMDFFGTEIFSKVIAGSPHLQTLAFDERVNQLSYFRQQPEVWFSIPCPRLTSLTIWHFSLSMDKLESALPQTPSLRHLLITSSSLEMIDGYRWENLIKTELPLLNKFEFYLNLYSFTPAENTSEKCVLNELVAPFRTPFWVEEKRWLVTCNWFPNKKSVEMYTSPICMSSYEHVFDLDTKSISNLDSENESSTMLQAVDELELNLRAIFGNKRVSQIIHWTAVLL